MSTELFSNLVFELFPKKIINPPSTTLQKKTVQSLRMCLRIFSFSSFQLTCAALLLGTCSFTMSFPNESFQSEELVAAYFRDSFQQQSLQQDELQVAYSQSPTRARQLQHDSFQQKKLCSKSLEHLSEQLCSTQLCRSTLDSFNQLDLEISLSLTWLGSTRCRTQLQANIFARSSFEHRALPCAALLDTPRISTKLQNRSVQSFQLTRVQLSSLAQGGVQHRASHQPALNTRALSLALTLTSLSLALDAWLKTSSKRAWRSRPLSTRSSRRSSSTRASPTALAPSSTTTATSSLRRTLLSVLWFSFLVNNIFIGNSFWRKELVEHNELSQTVLEQELEELLADKPFRLDPFHDHLGKENLWSDQLQQNNLEKNKNNKLDPNQLQEEPVPDRELCQLHLYQLHDQDQPFSGTKQLPKEQRFTSCLLRQMISNFSKKKLERLHLTRSSLEENLSKVQLLIYKFFPENFGQQLSEKQLQHNLSTDQRQLQNTQLTQTSFQQLSLEQPSFQRRL